MRRVLLFAACLWLLSQESTEAQVGPSCPWVGPQAYAKETITVSTTSIGFTAATIASDFPGINSGNPVAYARVQLQADSIYVLDTGGAATNTDATLTLANSGPWFYVCGQRQVQAFRALRVTTDATLRVVYYR